MARFSARFTVDSFEPSTVSGVEGDWVAAIVMRKTYTDGIDGGAVLHFVHSGEDPSRGYLAVERISGSIDGVPGEVTVHHGGLQHPGGESAFGYVIPGTGIGAFSGWVGTASIVHDDGGTTMVFELH